MSRIDDLIATHCPDGVEFKEMGEVGEFIRGRRFTKNDIVPSGIGSIHYGEIYTHYGTSATSVLSHVRADRAPQLRFAKSGDLVIAAVGETVEDVCKAVACLAENEIAVHDDCPHLSSHDEPSVRFVFFPNCGVSRAEEPARRSSED